MPRHLQVVLSEPAAALRLSWAVTRTAPLASGKGGPDCAADVTVTLAGESRQQLLEVRTKLFLRLPLLLVCYLGHIGALCCCDSHMVGTVTRHSGRGGQAAAAGGEGWAHLLAAGVSVVAVPVVVAVTFYCYMMCEKPVTS